MPRPPETRVGLIDWLADKVGDKTGYTPYNNWSYDWCRFRKNQRCMYPKESNEAATAEAGYQVWVPLDRGYCSRGDWDMQKQCPVGEPGPHSGDPKALIDATIAWEDGGQRLPPGGYVS